MTAGRFASLMGNRTRKMYCGLMNALCIVGALSAGVTAQAAEDLKLSGDEPAAAAPAVDAAPAEAQPASVAPAQQAPQVEPIRLAIPAGTDPAVAWNDHFARVTETPAAIAETARDLMQRHEFAQVAALIQAALRNQQAQPWMYEGLAIALEASGAPTNEIERALLSALDLNPNYVDFMCVGMYLGRTGLTERALEVFQQASTMAPTRPEPFVQGLRMAQLLNDVDGIGWAAAGILRQAWPKEQADVWQTAYRAAEATLTQLKEAGRDEDATKLKAELDQAMVRDCVVTVRWTGDADVDIAIAEPAGTVCSHRNPRTTSGGVMLGDAFARASERSAEGCQEVYVCPEGFDGTYKLLLRRVWGKPTAGKVTVDVYTHYGSQQVVHVGQQIPLGVEDVLVNFELRDGRRQESLSDAQVANAAAQQVEVNRFVLGQQLAAAGANNNAAASLAGSRTQTQGSFPLLPFLPQAVGFAPVIRTIPAGSSLTILPSVISADRRYVRVSPLPLFSAISQVNTFNFATGQGGTSGGQTGGGFSGGAGGGFGGGGTGLGGGGFGS